MVIKSQKIIVKIDDKHVTSVYISNYVPGQGLISDVTCFKNLYLHHAAT